MDFGADAHRFAEEDSGRGVAVGDGLDVHGSMIQLARRQHKLICPIYMGTQWHRHKSRSTGSSRLYEENGAKKSGNFGLVVREPVLGIERGRLRSLPLLHDHVDGRN